MKTITFVSLLMGLGTLGFAQQTPTPPSPPTTPTTTSTSSSTSSNYEHSVSNSKGDKRGNLSISISESNGTYKMRAKFPSKNDATLKELLLREFGEENLQQSGKDLIWKFTSANAEIYSIKLSSGKLRMELDKEQAANSLIDKFVRVGEDINRLLSGEGDEKSIALEREAAMLQKKSLRMQQEADRLQKGKEKELSDSQAKALNRKSEELQLQVDSLKRELRKLKEEN